MAWTHRAEVAWRHNRGSIFRQEQTRIRYKGAASEAEEREWNGKEKDQGHEQKKKKIGLFGKN